MVKVKDNSEVDSPQVGARSLLNTPQQLARAPLVVTVRHCRHTSKIKVGPRTGVRSA
jgi:hypothetical protein